MSRRSWTDHALTEAVAKSKNIRQVIRSLGLKAEGSYSTVKKYINKLSIDISHFETSEDKMKRTLKFFSRIPIEAILVEGSKYNRTHLKNRLYKEGIKQRVCEICGQGELWNGKKMSLILDHVNGINDDNRIINIRIVCPNCNATLETHCGKKGKNYCPVCGDYTSNKKYCSNTCSGIAKRGKKTADNTHLRKALRPPYEVLVKEINLYGYRKTGLKYGVSDNAIRNWLKYYRNNNGASSNGRITDSDSVDRGSSPCAPAIF